MYEIFMMKPSHYLETDASQVGLGATLLQTRSSTSFPRDIAPDNSILRPMTFSSKSLSSTERNTVELAFSNYPCICQPYFNAQKGFQYILHYIGRPPPKTQSKAPPDRFSTCFGGPLFKENHTFKIKGMKRWKTLIMENNHISKTISLIWTHE